MEWKEFLTRYKWAPVSLLRRKFGISKYDFDNFLRKADVRQVVGPWRLSHEMDRERLRSILGEAWEYYLVSELGMRISDADSDWVPRMLRIRNVGRPSKGENVESSGLSFLVNSRYLIRAFGREYDRFISKGYTTVAFCMFNCFPRRDTLATAGVVPFMFQQTHRKALRHVDPISMVEYIYLTYWPVKRDELRLSKSSELALYKKDLFVARHTDAGFITGDFLDKYGVPYNLYKDHGIRSILSQIASEYSEDLGISTSEDSAWSRLRFLERFPDFNDTNCRYCRLSPVDLHHLLPRRQYPQYLYERTNVVPLCLPVHGAITRRKLPDEIMNEYNCMVRKWLRSREESTFDGIMREIHDWVY